MNDTWTCIMIGNVPEVIPERVRTALMVGACDLHSKQWSHMYLMNDDVGGLIKTEGAVRKVGTAYGLLFHAEVEGQDGTLCKINFLLNAHEMHRRAMSPGEIVGCAESTEETSILAEVPELYEFYDIWRPGDYLH